MYPPPATALPAGSDNVRQTVSLGQFAIIYFGNDSDSLCGQFFTADCHVRFFVKASQTRVRKVSGFTYTGMDA